MPGNVESLEKIFETFITPSIVFFSPDWPVRVECELLATQPIL